MFMKLYVHGNILFELVGENINTLSNGDHTQERHIRELVVQFYREHVLVCEQCSQKLLEASFMWVVKTGCNLMSHEVYRSPNYLIECGLSSKML